MNQSLVTTNSHPTIYAPRTVEEVVAVALEFYPRLISRNERWIAHYENRLVYERAMLGDQGGIATDKTGPEVGGACKCWVSARGCWSYIVKVNKVSVTVLDNWGHRGENFTRTVPFDKLSAIMTKAQVEEARSAGLLVEAHDKNGFGLLREKPKAQPAREKTEEEQEFEARRDAANAGVQVVTAPQLFPTPPEIAARVIELADIWPGHRVLEPSAGTGVLIKAIPAGSNAEICAIEINRTLAQALDAPGALPFGVEVRCADFLTCNGDLGLFDRIMMNPPFENGSDIRHI